MQDRDLTPKFLNAKSVPDALLTDNAESPSYRRWKQRFGEAIVNESSNEIAARFLDIYRPGQINSQRHINTILEDNNNAQRSFFLNL
jgi:hypothetical protein